MGQQSQKRQDGKLRAPSLIPLSALPLVPQSRAAIRAGLFVTQVLPLPIKPQTWLSAEPVREAITFPLSDGEGAADIYRVSDGKVRAGVLVTPGISPAPRDDHRIINLGKALALAGFVAMFPWSPSMMSKRFNLAEPDNLVRAFEYLRGLEYVDPDRVGMAGFCVGASMLIVAASDSRISDEVNFVSDFGGYYDMRDLFKQISSNRSFYRRTVEPWDPNHLTEEVLTNHLIESLGEENEREMLTRIFIEKDSAQFPALDGISAEGRAVYGLLDSLNAHDEGQRLTLEEADRLVGDLPTGFLEELKTISPSTNIGDLKAQLLIAHDREDNLVPAEESRRMADALSGRGRIRHTEFSFFSHVTPGKRVGPFTFMKEAFKLFRYTYSIVRVTT